jgi:hypothetical protein
MYISNHSFYEFIAQQGKKSIMLIVNIVARSVLPSSKHGIIFNLFCYNFLYLLPLHISFHSVMRMSADLRDLFFYKDFLYYYLLLVVSLFHHLSLCHAERSLPIEKEDKLIVRHLYLCVYINFMVLLITCHDYLVMGSKFMRLRTIIGQLF